LCTADGLLLGPGRARLLEAVDETGSISTAARSLGMSYRKAWRLAETVNQAAPESVVERFRGGAGGGGARLTFYGKSVIAAFRALQGELTAVCDRHARQLSAGLSDTGRSGRRKR
jgi:molybdate transport system regulatory protein